MEKRQRVVVAMSGGVDSSVAAGLMVEAGHEVIGLSMKTHADAANHSRACCTPDDMRDARRVADLLGIKFYVLNYEQLFREQIIGPFADAYLRGETPNPCVTCNHRVKFRPLLERAQLLGADTLVTGHYARVDKSGDRARLLRGVDPNKDQSYFLYRFEPEQLGSVDFPLGEMNKDEVRDHARRLGLPVADKSESQEICFVGKEGYAKVVERIRGHGGASGNFVDADGKVLGEHPGIHNYTYGQRRGLRLVSERPVYVTHIDPESGDVTVGGQDDLHVEAISIREPHLLTQEIPSDGVMVQQRHRGTPSPATVTQSDGHLHVAFAKPVRRGAPGQAAVLYHGDEVLGGGVIERSAQPADATYRPSTEDGAEAAAGVPGS